MKKKILMISVVLMGVAVAISADCWAARERAGDRRMDRSGRFQDANDRVGDKFTAAHVRDRGSAHFSRREFKRHRPRFKHKYDHRHHYRPAHRFRHKHHYRPGQRMRHRYFWRHHYRPPHRFRPGYRFWRHRKLYRHGPPGHFKWRHRRWRSPHIDHPYGSAHHEEEFRASAAVSDGWFSVSVAASKID